MSAMATEAIMKQPIFANICLPCKISKGQEAARHLVDGGKFGQNSHNINNVIFHQHKPSLRTDKCIQPQETKAEMSANWLNKCYQGEI